MALTTAQKRKAISDTIRDHHLAFMIEVLGKDSVSPEDYKRLKAAGKVKEDAEPVQDAATAAAVLGAMSAQMDAAKMKLVPVKGSWNNATMDVLSPIEKQSVVNSKAKIAEYIKGLGNKVDEKTGHLIVDAEAGLQKKEMIQNVVADGVQKHKTIKQIVVDLIRVTGDAVKSWMVIAQTEVHNVMESAKANVIASNVPQGTDPLVFKRPRHDACPFCKLLYLKDGVVPRVFRLSELVNNGTNVGRKARKPTLKGAMATEWKPVLGAMHPWCACTLSQMPQGFVFDSKGVLQYVGVKKSMEQTRVETLDRTLLNHECG